MGMLHLPPIADLPRNFQEVENTETKLAILETIRTIAVRLENHISPFTDQIVSILPGLWEASGEEHLLKQAILTILSTLVGAMKGQSQRVGNPPSKFSSITPIYF